MDLGGTREALAETPPPAAPAPAVAPPLPPVELASSDPGPAPLPPIVGAEDPEAITIYSDYEKDVMLHSISAADSKAGFALTISLTLAGIEIQPLLDAIKAGNALLIGLLLVTLGILLTSVGAAFLTITPRLVRHETEGLIFWGSKNFSRSLPDYVKDCQRDITLVKLQEQQLAHLYITAQISRSKYKHLTFSLWLIPFGIAFLFITRVLG